MDPRPCLVDLGDAQVPGRVLAWWQEGGGWWGVVRYRAPGPAGYVMNYERRVPAASLRPVEAGTDV